MSIERAVNRLNVHADWLEREGMAPLAVYVRDTIRMMQEPAEGDKMAADSSKQPRADK